MAPADIDAFVPATMTPMPTTTMTPMPNTTLTLTADSGGSLVPPSQGYAPAPVISYAGGATNGVALTSGASILGSVKSAVQKACAEIPADKTMALVAVTSTVNGELRSNLAVAVRKGDHFEAEAWMGRSWKKDANTEWGAQVHVTF